MAYRVAMIGAGSAFTQAIARELVHAESLRDCAFVLMDVNRRALATSARRVRQINEQAGAALKLSATTSRRRALDGADFVITSFAPQRIKLWQQDIDIPARYGVHLMQGENGGPAGQIHALRNITILMEIVRDMRALCPSAWLMNFTNPMSMLCTCLRDQPGLKWLGFCHQVHGSFGVVAEMLGMAPGDLRVITAGINHMNFLLDIRRRGESGSYMEPFLKAVRKNKYWRRLHENVPEQRFTLDFLDAFGVYPVGYDNHICEYLPMFYTKAEWDRLGYHSVLHYMKKAQVRKKKGKSRRANGGTLEDLEIWRQASETAHPFPKDATLPYYKESPVDVMQALLTAGPLYMDAMVTVNNGAIANLPHHAVVDVPGVIVGGAARPLTVGPLPAFAAELCRRQIVIHELIAQAALTGDRRLFLQALCLDPYVRGLSTARNIMDAYLRAYRRYLPQFR